MVIAVTPDPAATETLVVPCPLVPRRPHLAAARTIVEDTPEPTALWDVGDRAEAAWEALIAGGLLPESWHDDPRRRFEQPCPRCRGTGRALGRSADAGLVDSSGRPVYDPCPVCPRRPHPWRRGTGLTGAPRPRMVREMVAIASDVPGVRAVEELAREAAQRLAAFGGPKRAADAPVVWRFSLTWPEETSQLWRSGWAMPGGEGLVMALRLTDHAPNGDVWDWVAQDRHHRDRYAAGGQALGTEHVVTAAWTAAHRDGYADQRNPRRAPRRPNPWAPLVDIFERGYVLDAVTDTALVLVCPEL